MKKFRSLVFTGLGLFAISFSIFSPAALAATSSSGSGQALEIAPPVMTLSAKPGQTLQTQIKLRDISSSKLFVTNEIDDFVAAGEDGTPKIITGDDTSNPFSLKRWITSVPSLLLSPKQIKTLPITIQVPKNASPGGHYGVIRFTGTAPELNGTGVSLSASIGALVLLTVSGKINDSLSVQDFSVNKNDKTGKLFESAPLNFVVRLKNTGNIQEQPAGHIIVTNMFGKAVAGLNINLPPRNVLPDSTRKFTAALDSSVLGHKRLFGLYHAKLNLTYGTTTKKTLTKNITFWVIPYKLIGIGIVVLIGGFFALRLLVKRYNQRIISKAQKSQRK